MNKIGDKQVIIWCQYKFEIEKIVKLLRNKNATYATAYGETKKVDDSIKQFKRGNVQYLIAHPRTLMYGVTLTNCNYSIYYSISYSFEELYQSHDRIYRNGQKLACTYYFLQARNTIDEEIYKCVIAKKGNTELVENILKAIAKREEVGNGKKPDNEMEFTKRN